MAENLKPIVLLILDGWGIREESSHNPIKTASTPVMDKLLMDYPHTSLIASGTEVGLPPNQIGNSEVGHLHIGAGRRVPQDLTRINEAIDSGEFTQNKVFLDAIAHAKQNNRAIHLLGLVSPGGVHSHLNHFVAMLTLMAQQDFNRCYTHAILDGRDTLPKTAAKSLQTLMQLSSKLNTGHIASVIGRYYAMDRDQRWQRIEQAYNLLVEGTAKFKAPDPLTALEMAYARNETDEFVQATLIQNSKEPSITLQEGDIVIFMNFRADRARELCYALTNETFNEFSRKKYVKLDELVTLTHYANNLASSVAFPPINLNNVLGEYLAKHHCRQLRIAETEKYAHVTYFLNGGQETLFPLEDRILISSPKVATYDLQPEMSAVELTDKLVSAIESKQYDVIMCNYANPDMLGHTGIESAALKAVTTIDHCLGRIIKSALATSTQVLITADHGNIEQIYDETTGQPHTAHTTNLVPLIYVGEPAEFIHSSPATLVDIAPTLLSLLGLEPPSEMTGRNLIHKKA